MYAPDQVYARDIELDQVQTLSWIKVPFPLSPFLFLLFSLSLLIFPQAKPSAIAKTHSAAMGRIATAI